MTISIVGHVCIDQNSSEHADYSGAGGPATFIYKIIRQLPDIKTYIFAPYGKTFLQYKDNLPLYPLIPPKEETLIYRNITKNGKRTQYALHRESADFAEMDINMKEEIQKSDIVIVAPLLPNLQSSYIKQLRELAPDAAFFLLPQGYFRNFNKEDIVIPRDFVEAKEILPYFDAVILSRDDHPEMYKLANIWANSFNTHTIITEGPNGATLISKESHAHVPTKEVLEGDIIDSVGSGDIFSISCAFEFHKSRDLIRGICFGNAIARQCLFYTPENLTINLDEASLLSEELFEKVDIITQ